MVASILTAVISGLLIYGIKQIRYSMLVPWLVLSTFSLVLNYFGLLTYLLSFVATTSLDDFVIFLLLVFSAGPFSYIYYVIYSLYTHMKMDFGMCRVFTPPPAAEVQLKQNDPASYI
ncbi:uncharacterized protein LOC117570401 [Drosophila albomicans]|uniref:Uncharacterized protein LOC117570401 n=1 Tax=Drosophila albomicans TaxID=7291 RepID=A0A6P8X3U0_DROAB|nr:uncharacterized protein LOC117570401 [Drosophila albomicans]